MVKEQGEEESTKKKVDVTTEVEEMSLDGGASLSMKVFTEFMGSAALMLSVLASGGNFLVVALTLAIIMFLLGGISGCAVNPAIAAGLWYSGSLNAIMFFAYATAEILGALAAVYAYKIVS